MSDPALRRMTLAEFLEWDDGTDTRYELIDGLPVAMAPASPVHTAVAGALSLEIGRQLKSPCRIMPEMGVVPRTRRDTRFAADVAVTCFTIEVDSKVSPDPVVIAEVLSPSTQRYDRAGKLDAYRHLPSVTDVLLVWSTARRVEHWRRLGADWVVQDVVGRGRIALEALDVAIDLDAIYNGIKGLES